MTRIVSTFSIAVVCLVAFGCKRSKHEGSPHGGASLEGAMSAPAKSAGAPKRPPKPHPVATPALPDLPALAKHEKPGKAPKPSSDSYPCGSVYTGTEHVALQCLEEHDGAKLEKTVTVLVPYDKLGGKMPALPVVVDHRADSTEAAVRGQGATGMCSTFGASAAFDHSVARWSGTPGHFSVMQIWARYHHANFSVLSANAGKTLAAEETWPFDPKVAWSWHSCPKKGGSSKDGPCDQPVDEARLAAADAKPAAIIEQVEMLPRDFELLRAKVAAGEDPIILIRLGGQFNPKGSSGSRYIPDYDDEKGGHFLAVAGYAMMPGKGGAGGDNYYLLHNSWGRGWGDGGYAWIHEATLVKHMYSQFGVVDVRPLDGPRAHRGGQTCAGDLVPDSATGACAAACADGAPRHNGFCSDSSDCPSGFVNLVGSCVLAAPADKARDEASNIAWRCGPGGCAYAVPKSVGACNAEPCTVSCPAPSFRIAKDHRGVTCVE